jgi:hypothetical protein
MLFVFVFFAVVKISVGVILEWDGNNELIEAKLSHGHMFGYMIQIQSYEIINKQRFPVYLTRLRFKKHIYSTSEVHLCIENPLKRHT